MSRTVVVIGHGADEVKASLTDFPAVSFALQQPQLGTGHALQQALPLLDPAAEMTLVLLGDVPLIQPETIARLRDAAGDGMALLTAVLRNPTGYGRILRKGAASWQLLSKRTPPKARNRFVKSTQGSCCCPLRALRAGFRN